MGSILFPGPGLGPLGVARGGARLPQSTYSLALTAASSQYVSVPDSATLDFTTQLSVGLWKKSNIGNNAAFLAKWNYPTDGSWEFEQDSHILEMFTADAADDPGRHLNSVAGVLSVGVWQHVGFSFNSGAVKFYVDGVPVYSGSTTVTSLRNSGAALMLGTFPGFGRFFDGLIDDVFCLAGALTDANFAALAAGTLNPATLSYAGGGGLWPFEDQANPTADSSGNGNSGALANGPTFSTDVPTQLQ